MKKKKNLFYYLKKDRFIYLLMLPGLIWYLVFRYFPMLGIVIAFEDYKPFWGIEGIFTSNWVGFKHFIKFFQSHLGYWIQAIILIHFTDSPPRTCS